MSKPGWGFLTPEAVSTWISFERGTFDWEYPVNNPDSMAAKQAQGVAYLWNLLSKQGVALLSDEVGMGKTIQALGVAALLWKMKPNAKVLVMAPNRDICKGWMREFHTFVDLHYREADHLVKNAVDGGPVPAVQFCQRLHDLEAAIKHGAGHLFLTTIGALSGLVPTDKKGDIDKQSHAAGVAACIRKNIQSTPAGGFDLVIIDEAHYLRNIEGGSQKVAAAKAFFGGEGERLSAQTLLLTATPAHTRIEDVHNVLSYFLHLEKVGNTSQKQDGRELLKQYSLRRLRLLEGRNGANSKHQYRFEKGVSSDFKGNPNAEVFFALYQKRLVEDLHRTKENKSLMYGYLEGFESMGRRGQSDLDTSGDGDDTEKSAQDWSSARDSKLLQDLAKEYYQQFNQFPDHPKYGALVKQCVPQQSLHLHEELEDLKHLIFVRRIPSVRELTQRINASYDDLFAGMIIAAWGLAENDPSVERWRSSRWSLNGYKKLFASLQEVTEENEEDDISTTDSDITPTEDSDYLASRIAELFVVKKGKGTRAHTVNVRLRFTKPENVFSLFLEPAADYLDAGYTTYYQDVGTGKPDYSNAALFTRQQSWPNNIERIARVTNEPTNALNQELKTVWSLILPLLNDDEREKLNHWATVKPTVAENFGNYLKAGFLHASPVIVELYCWYVQFRREDTYKGRPDAQREYRKFYTDIQKRIPGSLLLRYFKAALSSFDALCGKIFDHEIDAWEDEWRSLKRLTSPAWYASGEIAADNRQRLIMGFNSPFYPNVLVATSVFKEGVNLHMACHQVHHYGLAGSPGDNEQRVGRIDRLFGCVNNRLKSQDNAELNIYFPYLKGSVDEDQVASFIQRKRDMEDQMDACLPPAFEKNIDISSSQDWESYLRKPQEMTEGLQLEPYPPSFDKIGGSAVYKPAQTHTPAEVDAHIESLLRSVAEAGTLEKIDELSGGAKRIFKIDPQVEQHSKLRHQPIIVEKYFYPGISALVEGTAYVLSFVSPISNKYAIETEGDANLISAFNRIEAFIEDNYDHYPLVRVCVNERATNSFFYLSLRVDLPVFSRRGKLEMLSRHEVKMAFEQLKEMADALEYMLFDGTQDLAFESLGDLTSSGTEKVRHKKLLKRKGSASAEWTAAESKNGEVSQLAIELDNENVEAHFLAAELEKTQDDAFFLLCQLNQRYPFVNFTRKDQQSRLQLNFPAADLNEDESTLLKAWFAYVVTLGDGTRSS